MGPTVYEAAESTINQCQRQIEELQSTIRLARQRLENPAYAHMLEAERIATRAEAFMKDQL